MALLETLWISEGLQWLLLSMALILVTLFLIRYLSFYFRLRKTRKQDMDLALELGKRLKKAKLRSLDEIIDEQDDEMFRKGGRLPRESARAKPLVIPASYEARVAKARNNALRKKQRRKARLTKAKKTRRKKSTGV